MVMGSVLAVVVEETTQITSGIKFIASHFPFFPFILVSQTVGRSVLH